MTTDQPIIFLEKYQVVHKLKGYKRYTSYLCTYNQEKYIVKAYLNGMDAIKTHLDSVSFETPYMMKRISYGLEHNCWVEVYPYHHEGNLFQASQLMALSETYLGQVVVPALVFTLEEIHQKGLIHGEICPKNLFVHNKKIVISYPRFLLQKDLRGYCLPMLESTSEKQADFYSMGMTLLHLVLGEAKFKEVFQAAQSDPDLEYLSFMDEGVLSDEWWNLINGLTQQESSQRWGLDELKKWMVEYEKLFGVKTDPASIFSSTQEKKQISDEADEPSTTEPKVNTKEEEINQKNENVKHYLQSLHTKGELLHGILKEWNNIRIYPNLIVERIETLQLDISSLTKELAQTKGPDRKLYVITEYLKEDEQVLCYWKGKAYLSLDEIKNEVEAKFPDVHSDLFELLVTGTFEAIFPKTQQAQKSQRWMAKIADMMKASQKDRTLAYYKWYYLLTQDQTFTFQLGTADSIQQFVEMLHKDKDQAQKISTELLHNKIFFAWLGQKGFDTTIQTWKEVVKA
jgi:hypothetical protein